MSCPFETPLSDIISCIIDKRSLDLKGIYFLTLELKVIINKIVQNIENDKYNDYFQICVYASQASGIKFIIKHKNNIITIRNLEYPFDKTTGYVQGIIEQEINDCLILFKNYISNLDQRACIILIVDEELKSLLESTNFEERPVIFIPVDNILNKQTLEKERFIDTNISRLFLEYKSFPAYNNNLKSIKKLVTIKDLTFKLYSALLIILILVVGIIKYNTKQNYKDINSINEKYYATNQEYDGIKYKYPYIKNTTSLADLYVIEKLLEAPVPLPFDLLKRLIITLNPAFKLEEIKWELTNIDNILLVSKRQLIIKLILKYHTNNLSVDESLKMLDDHMTNVKNKLSNLQIDYVIYKDKILDIFGKVVIPLSVNIVDNKT
ncbi:putative glycyl-tRNA synthetase subunit alpha [Rickettsia amblyommatis str. Darkwater]|nr:putative glycyl-tRNA synthetase subunit alpha [Rickettsia amblyommatis str. Darkwater]